MVSSISPASAAAEIAASMAEGQTHVNQDTIHKKTYKRKPQTTNSTKKTSKKVNYRSEVL